MPRSLAERFSSWLDRARYGILAVSVLVALAGGYLASKMAIQSDLTHLLPQSKRSVRELLEIQKRARPFATISITVESKDPALRAKAGAALAERLPRLDKELVAQFTMDDGPLRRYAWAHRFLFAELADLRDARDALAARIEHAKLVANPLYIPLDDDDPQAAPPDRLAELEAKLADAEKLAKTPPLRVSKDGTFQLLTLQTAFTASDTHRARTLLTLVERELAAVTAEVGPGVEFGLSGNITFSLHEHDSVLEGMTRSVVITVVLCAIGLLLYYRSGKVVLAMLWALGVGVAATFAMAKLMVGNLNVMTAFLFAIVVGNGINAGLILVARFLEELRVDPAPGPALTRAIAAAMRGTLAATATAGVAYTSLLVTDFRGFRQFGAIAGVGMTLTWITTFTVLPALLFVLGRAGLIRPTKAPAIGDVLARLIPRRGLGWVLAGAGVVTAAAAVITTAFIAHDPFTHDWRDLQSTTPAISRAREVDRRINEALDTSGMLNGQAYQLAIAVDRRDQVMPLVTALRTADQARPPEHQWMRDVRSLDDLLPTHQEDKLAVLREITALLDTPELDATLSDKDRAELARVRPAAADLALVTDKDVPFELAWPFIEKDGSIGRLIVIRGAKRFNSFNVDHRLEFAAEVRKLSLPAGAVVAGESLVVADIIETMEADAPDMVVFALVGSVLAVFVVIGLRRHGLVTLACGFGGVVVMIAACALVGLKVHFLDLIALPITIGIGIDYAVNLAARDRQDGELGPKHLLRTTGGTVLLCSFTTAVGYGTLMLSANGGIRAFGEAALLGEVACIGMALVATPAWLALLRGRRDRPGQKNRSDLPA